MNKNYNPDVLTCLANLSSDEVFTPPQMANEILNHLPPEIWRDKDARFLDPFCKSGVFLREITKRLLVGLEKQIPDQQKRVNHILQNQVFGIAITELTALLSRRSVYCSKTANGKYSVCDSLRTSRETSVSRPSNTLGKTGVAPFAARARKNTPAVPNLKRTLINSSTLKNQRRFLI